MSELKIKISAAQDKGTTFRAQPENLYVGGVGMAKVDRLVFDMPEEWKKCSVTLHVRRMSGTLPEPVVLDSDCSAMVDKHWTLEKRGTWMLMAVGDGGYIAMTKPGKYECYETIDTDGAIEEITQSVYEQFVAEVIGSANKAKASEQAAATSEASAKASETNAKQSETNAKASETSASASATAAGKSASAAANSEKAAATSESHAKLSETNAAASAITAGKSASAAANSETNAKTSETNAAKSEQNAAASEANAKASEKNALASEQAAAVSKTSAANSARTATVKANEAAASAASAEKSKTAAASSAADAIEAADKAQVIAYSDDSVAKLIMMLMSENLEFGLLTSDGDNLATTDGDVIYGNYLFGCRCKHKEA